ncbi:hypothetical protein DRQ50_09750 [bacterium]|nr:MAG: hypothetical protein DRQ50_09750 [bacterium]
MFTSSRHLVLSLLLLVVLALAACQDSGTGTTGFVWKPVFGDVGNDHSQVIARVAGVEITEEDLNLRYDELPANKQRTYEGEEGHRLLLKKMVDTVWMVRGAVDLELENRQEVARTLISHRRITLEQSMKAFGLFEQNSPSDEQLQTFFAANRKHYNILGRVLARHVQCAGKAEADQAYERLQSDGRTNAFPFVVKDLSNNRLTAAEGGSLGWFNEGGFIPNVRDSEQLAKIAYNRPDGLNPPLFAGGAWHVIEVEGREPPRPMTFNEARSKVEQDFLPSFQSQLVTDYLAEARTRYPVEYSGQFAPGGGVSAEALFQRARVVTDPEKQLEILTVVIEDFPESDRVDDSLFLAAQAVMERWGEARLASRYLQRLVDEYPDSELVEDAKYLLENMGNSKIWSPESIEDLRR